jgi:hypothetical protein
MKRWLVKLALFLLAGAIINVAVGWLCVVEQLAPAAARKLPDPQRLWDRYARPEYRHARARYEFEWIKGAPGVDFLRLIGDLPPEDQGCLPQYWPPNMLIVRAGLPLRSVESMNGWGPLAPEARWGIPIAARNPNIAWVSLLPCRPIVSGFIINTLLLAGFIFSAVEVPRGLWRSARRNIRSHRGLCPTCGYPIGTSSVCTECGGAVMRHGMQIAGAEDGAVR